MRSMKFVAPRPFADPEAAAQKLMEIANAVEAVQDGRIFIELINGPFLFEHKGRIRRGSQACDRTRLAVGARERHLRKAHPGRRRTIHIGTLERLAHFERTRAGNTSLRGCVRTYLPHLSAARATAWGLENY